MMTPRTLTRAIIEAVADHYGVPPESIYARDQRGPVVKARHVAMYLVYERWPNYMGIGRLLGRHNSTAHYAVVSVRDQCEVYPEFAREVACIRAVVGDYVGRGDGASSEIPDVEAGG